MWKCSNFEVILYENVGFLVKFVVVSGEKLFLLFSRDFKSVWVRFLKTGLTWQIHVLLF